MYTASQARRDNIAEYLLYMWLVEDMIRSNNLDSERMAATIVNRYPDLTETQRREMLQWYESLAEMMRREDVVHKGHLQMNRNLMSRLSELHQELLSDPEKNEYRQTFYKALPHIVELRSKTPEADRAGEIETCFNALYGLWMLRLQHKDITPATQQAMDVISAFMAQLAHEFALDEQENG